MQRILVATDFSTRSDRALRRASLLARQSSADLTLVHVIDDDQPGRLVEIERREATALLHDLARTVREADKITCDSRVVLGTPFQEIANAADELGADLIVLGPHRRQILRDSFLGTTAERAIRHSRRPIMMANAVPAGPYRTILIAVDFSDTSLVAAQAAKKLGLFERTRIMALHVFDAPVQSPTLRASMTMQEFERRITEEEQRVSKELDTFLHKVGIDATRQVVKLAEQSTAMAIADCARKAEADLLVVGTHGRTGIEKWFIGSVAESVLSNSDVDVLAVPPQAKAS